LEVEEIKKALHDYIVERYTVGADDASFNDDVHLFDYGYVDSFGAVDLINFVEKSFQVTVSQGDLVAYPLDTITQIATFVSLRQKGEL
jgi:methoxymalonate biosynthesis acyl carrier protein